ncbi:MAG: thioredoxin [Flavobacteriales bacterium]|nr:thioredoxin [Flavobacteriales bacterium]
MERPSFQQLIQGDKPVVVDFFATWCGPCKAMAPIIEDLKHRVGEQAVVLKVDVDRNPAAAQAYRIQGVPTIAVFHKGQLVWRQAGVVSADQIQSVLSRLN